MPNWRADARRVPRGAREVMPRGRYVVEADPELPCALAPIGAPARGTRCYAEHSRARKACRLLVPRAELRLRPGLHVWGASPAFAGADARRLVCHASNFVGTDVHIDSAAAAPERGAVLVLGPYADAGDPVARLKCVLREDLEVGGFVTRATLNELGNSFLTPDFDKTVPTAPMMRRANADLVAAGLPSIRTLDAMAESEERAASLRRRLAGAGPERLRTYRLLARLFFQLSMYLYKWAGPGRPYPTTNDASQLPVGGAANPVSEALRGKRVIASARGVRLVSRGDHPPADAVNDERRLANMEHALLGSIRAAYDALPAAEATLVHDAFREGTLFDMCDGSGYWTRDESMFDRCFAPGFSIATGNRCVRVSARPLMTGALTVALALYKSPPAWTRFEGRIDYFINADG